ncbi:hypothetical protein N7G274_002003 [Stereocaulon virgatum]|uniref:Uncharacterized protein n=1 Tax=Stereocaulon virgatum TaxID=373712 RepID=A0ABR4AII8_9LECA
MTIKLTLTTVVPMTNRNHCPSLYACTLWRTKYPVSLLKDLAQENFDAALEILTIEAIPFFTEVIRNILIPTTPCYRGLRDILIPTLIALKQELGDNGLFMAFIAGRDDPEFYIEVMDIWGNFGKHNFSRSHCRYRG